MVHQVMYQNSTFSVIPDALVYTPPGLQTLDRHHCDMNDFYTMVRDFPRYVCRAHTGL